MDAPEETVHPARSIGRWVVRTVGFCAVLIPPIRMARIVRSGTPSQFADYWNMFPTVFRKDGWPSIRGLFILRNEHPVVLPKLSFWINHLLAGGSNISLGYWIIILGLAQVVVIAIMVRRIRDVPLWLQIALVVASSALLFGRLGSWNFVRAMSGSTWLLANVFVLVALSFECSPRRSPSLIFGVMASLSYGTGLMVWPALLAAGLIRDRKLRSHWRTIALGGVMAVVYLIMRRGSPSTASATRSPIHDLARNTAVVIGSSFGRERRGLDVALAVVIVGIGLLATTVVARRCHEESAPWVGLFVWGLLSSVLIADSRSHIVSDFGQSRYYSIGVLTTLAVLVLVAIAIRASVVLVPIAGLGLLSIAMLTWFTGASAASSNLDNNLSQDALAIALRIGVAHQSTQWTVLEPMPPIESLLRDTGQYPFNSDFTFGCGLIGTKLKSIDIRDAMPRGVTAIQSASASPWIPHGELFTGTVSAKPDCILVTDRDRNVVGAGASVEGTNQWHLKQSSHAQKLTAIAPAKLGSYRMYLRFPNSPNFYRVQSLAAQVGS